MTEMLTETIDIEERVEETQLTEFLPSEILDLAADLIDSAGWTQKGHCVGGAYCAGGAVAQLAVADPYAMYVSWGLRTGKPVDPALLKAMTFLSAVVSHGDGADLEDNVYSFNDAPGRTKGEVIAKLHEAADLARQSGE